MIFSKDTYEINRRSSFYFPIWIAILGVYILATANYIEPPRVSYAGVVDKLIRSNRHSLAVYIKNEDEKRRVFYDFSIKEQKKLNEVLKKGVYVEFIQYEGRKGVIRANVDGALIFDTKYSLWKEIWLGLLLLVVGIIFTPIALKAKKAYIKGVNNNTLN